MSDDSVRKLLLVLLCASLVATCAGQPTPPAPKPPTKEEQIQSAFADAQSFRLEAGETPWEQFASSASALLTGLGLAQVTNQPDLIFRFIVAGERTETQYQVSVSDRMGRMHDTHDTRSLPVGYKASGKMVVGTQTNLSLDVPLSWSVSGPEKIEGFQTDAAKRSKSLALQKALAGLCSFVLDMSSRTSQAASMAVHGKTDAEKFACLEWLSTNNGHRRGVIDAIVADSPSPAILARAIRAMGKFDVRYFCDLLVDWNASGDAELQRAIYDLKTIHRYWSCPEV